VSILLIIDILGTISFAISGVLTALKKKMDPFGILIIAFVTAVGGGTLRGVLINAPIVWMQDLTYFYIIGIAAVVAVIFKKKLGYVRKSLFLFDTIGIALYTIVGIEKGIEAGYPPLICIILGTISACFGGVIRDILCTEIPIIFRKEIYAIACIFGGILYFILLQTSLSTEIIVLLSGGVIVLIRVLAVSLKLSLPSLYPNEDKP